MIVNGYEIKSGADLRLASLRYANLVGANLAGASLRGADLRAAELRGANLAAADLRGANLRLANLTGANLTAADLRGADLRLADATGANLTCADLTDAYLTKAALRGAILRGAYLGDAILTGADLRGAIDIPPSAAARLCVAPPTGAYVAWKRCSNDVLVKMYVPSGALRSSATTRKCRASEVVVVEVIGADVGVSIHDPSVTYRVGDVVKCDHWDADRWVECGGGIHHYITREEAEAHS